MRGRPARVRTGRGGERQDAEDRDGHADPPLRPRVFNGKQIVRTKQVAAHDEQGAKAGDTVRIVETRAAVEDQNGGAWSKIVEAREVAAGTRRGDRGTAGNRFSRSADNSGARGEPLVIRVLGGSKPPLRGAGRHRRRGRSRTPFPTGQVKKRAEVVKAVIVRTAKETKRKDGFLHPVSTRNAAVLITDQGEPRREPGIFRAGGARSCATSGS